MSVTHECPCGCKAQLTHAYLACPSGWSSLPEELRQAVNASRRAWRRSRSDVGAGLAHRVTVIEAVAWLRDRAGGAR